MSLPALWHKCGSSPLNWDTACVFLLLPHSHYSLLSQSRTTCCVCACLYVWGRGVLTFSLFIVLINIYFSENNNKNVKSLLTYSECEHYLTNICSCCLTVACCFCCSCWLWSCWTCSTDCCWPGIPLLYSSRSLLLYRRPSGLHRTICSDKGPARVRN